jgi:hypothetical protein
MSSHSLALWLARNIVASLERVWRTQVPLMEAFFAWSAALGKILIVDNL